jgi:hypothetical protein
MKKTGRKKRIDWSAGEAKSLSEINKIVSDRLLNRRHLEALMQESFIQERVKIIKY